MNIHTILLILFMVAAVASVLVMIFNSNVFYAALSLIICLLSVAGIYAVLQAEFLAITQVMIYAVGVLILILFSIMLTNRILGKSLRTDAHNWFAGSVITISLCAILIVSYRATEFQQAMAPKPTASHIHQIGTSLMSTHLAPFEVSGILLLVCLIGASLTASYFKKT